MPLRRVYLVIFAVLALAVGGVGFYLRHHAKATEKAVAECDTPAPPPKPATPPPNLPGFAVEAACGPGEAPKSVTPKK